MTLFSTKQYVKQEQEASTLDLLWLFCFEDKEVPTRFRSVLHTFCTSFVWAKFRKTVCFVQEKTAPDLEVFQTISVQVLFKHSSTKNLW